VGPHL